MPALPPRVRVSIDRRGAPPGLARRAPSSQLRARLAPPPPMALPGSYDFARDAWFRGIGGVGRALGPVEVVEPAPGERPRRGARRGSAGISAAQLPGAQRRDRHRARHRRPECGRPRRTPRRCGAAGLTHLLSVSGLHIAAVVGAAMLLTLQAAGAERAAGAALQPGAGRGRRRRAGRGRLHLADRRAGADGAQLHRRLLVLAGIALGRDAISMRLVAVGALVVLLFRPEAIAGASFQMSFAAVDRDRRAAFERLGAGGCSSAATRAWPARARRARLLALVADRPGGRARADPVRALPFPPRRPLRRRRQHRRHPADDLRHHAAGGRRACCSTRSGSARRCGRRPAARSTALLGLAHWVAGASGAVAMLADDAALGLRR